MIPLIVLFLLPAGSKVKIFAGEAGVEKAGFLCYNIFQHGMYEKIEEYNR